MATIKIVSLFLHVILWKACKICINCKESFDQRRTETVDISARPKDGIRCPCLQYNQLYEWQKRNNTVYPNTSGINQFGIGCATHDEKSTVCSNASYCSSNVEYYCRDKRWCLYKWCYVDETQCNLQKRRSKVYQNLYYSYAACGYIDLFENPYNISKLQGSSIKVAYTSNTGGWRGAYNPNGSFVLNEDNWHGPTVEFVKEVADVGNFKLNVTQPLERLRFRSENFFDSKSSFDFCVYNVALGYLDLCIGAYYMNRKRTSITPFFQAFTDKIYLVTFDDSEQQDLSQSFLRNIGKVFQPFTFGTWCTISFFLCFFGVLMLVFEYSAPGNAFPRSLPVQYNNDDNLYRVELIPLSFQVMSSIYRSFLSFYHQAYEQTIVSTAGKIHLFAISAFILIVTVIYTANLAAILTADIQNKSVKTLEEAIHMGYNFCAIRIIGNIIAESHHLNKDLIVPDPIDLGGDGKPGFSCPKCSSRTRVLEYMRRTHFNSSLYCNAAFVTEQDLEHFHQQNMYCDVQRVLEIGKIPVGLPVSAHVFDGLSSAFHAQHHAGVFEKKFLQNKPSSQCLNHNKDYLSLTITQLSGVWIFCSSFVILALLIKWFRRYHANMSNRIQKRYYPADQWGNLVCQNE